MFHNFLNQSDCLLITPKPVLKKINGFVFDVKFKEDPFGWSDFGERMLGVFSETWLEGAIFHKRITNRSLWFIPASSIAPDVDYFRACQYGRSWVFITMQITLMSDSGDLIGVFKYRGFESDSCTSDIKEFFNLKMIELLNIFN